MTVPFNASNAFDLSHDHKLTCHMGKLVPVMCEEVCPGDVWRWNADVLLRLMPLVAPMMHDVNVFLHAFYVPTRILFDGFESFVTGGEDGNDNTTWPYVTAPSTTGFAVGSLADYLGLPTGVPDIQVSALPFRACAKIYNDWYRDENLVSKVALSTAAGSDTTTTTSMQTRAWSKDYFTGSLPWAQRGTPTYLPLGVSAPVMTSSTSSDVTNWTPLKFASTTNNAAPLSSNDLSVQASTGILKANQSSTPSLTTSSFAPNNLITDLTSATAVTINDLRTAFQIQRFLEKNARGGARYIEWLLSHFGVRSSDARLQRSEYLGGGKCPISVGEVLQTSSSDSTSPQGNMAGRAISYQNVPSFTKTFEEFGYIVCFMSIMPRASYQQGLRRMWTRKTRWDYPLPVFAHLGNQAVKNQEIYAQAPTVVDSDGNVVNDQTFGYQERYEELRRIPSTVHGQFRSTLNYWHMGRIFNSLPQLNQSFIECTPTKRVFAVTDPNEDECIVQIHHNIQAIRRYPKYGAPGLIDHD